MPPMQSHQPNKKLSALEYLHWIEDGLNCEEKNSGNVCETPNDSLLLPQENRSVSGSSTSTTEGSYRKTELGN